MKRVYPLMLVCICMAASAPFISSAQCLCGGGIPSTPVTYLVTLAPTSSSIGSVVFPQFTDTSASQTEGLTCVTLVDTFSAVSLIGVTNTDTVNTINTNFITSLTYNINGPMFGGISGSNNNTVINGPDTLGHFPTVTHPFSPPVDTATIGPDTMFNNITQTLSTSTDVTPYMGTGTTTFNITFGGGTLATGGTNFAYNVNTSYWGTFRLTYYWCPIVVLATSIKNFTAVPNGNTIQLQWITTNEQNNTNYEIQVSTDGVHFTSIGQVESDPSTAGSAAKYQYQYNPDQAYVGQLYFRIQQTDANGKVSYSTVLEVGPGGAPVSYQVYPNPVTNTLLFQFNSTQTGRYLLELINTAGQTIQEKAVTLAGTSQIRLDLDGQPAKGLYFLRTTDLTHNQNYVSKVFIN